MIPIDTIVSIKSGDEYGGKYTGKLGIIKKFTDDRVGVEFAGLKNHASKYGLFWFKKENVTPSLFDAPKRNDAIIPAALAKAFLNFTFGAPRASLGVKQVIFSGPKTIVFWLDGTKTIVSCGEGDHNDPYAGFCAAVTKRVFGSTVKSTVNSDIFIFGSSGIMLLAPVCFVVDTMLVRLGRSMALLNSKMVFAVLTLFLSSSAMRRTPLSVHL